MKLSLQFKMALMFFAVMVVSASISISALLLIFNPIMKANSEQQLTSVSDSISQLEELDIYTPDEIISLCTNNSFSVGRLDDKTPSLSKVIKKLDKKEVVIDSSGVLPNVTAYTKIYDEYYSIGSFASENIYWVVNFVVIIAFIVCIILGTVITAFISRTILQPIRDLNKATSEVARGNFSVRVREPDDFEYGSLTKNFNRMAEQLSGIETLRGDFISNVSHEFKTPLASIQGFARLLQDEGISEVERKEYTQVIIDETLRLSNLSSNILKLSKLENQTTIGAKKRFSLDEQIRRIILILEPAWSAKNIELDIALDDVSYLGNEDLMGQIWQNILGNAIKFTPKNGMITIQLYRTDNNITAKISDSGMGMSDEIKEKVFDKFYQGDHSRKTEGNGLGLALVKRIVELSDGKIYIEDSAGGGASFVVELPYIIEDMM